MKKVFFAFSLFLVAYGFLKQSCVCVWEGGAGGNHSSCIHHFGLNICFMMNITTIVPRRRVQGMGQLMLYEASDTFDNVNLLTYWTIRHEN